MLLIPTRVLLQNANLLLSFGRRYGLVGRNGLGKTTLLRMIAERQLQKAKAKSASASDRRPYHPNPIPNQNPGQKKHTHGVGALHRASGGH